MHEMDVMKLLYRELKAREVPVVEATDDRIVVAIQGTAISASLDELKYDFERDADPRLVARFVSGLLEAPPLPAWKQAHARVFLSLDAPADATDGRIAEPVTDSLRLGIAHADEDERILTPITEAHLRTWKISRKDAFETARGNMAGLLEETALELREIGPTTIATFTTRSVFKPALLFSPNLKQIAAPKLGWPILAFLPCREMVFLLEKDGLNGPPETQVKFLSFMLHEFIESRYSLTTEVLRIADEGISVEGVLGVWE